MKEGNDRKREEAKQKISKQINKRKLIVGVAAALILIFIIGYFSFGSDEGNDISSDVDDKVNNSNIPSTNVTGGATPATSGGSSGSTSGGSGGGGSSSSSSTEKLDIIGSFVKGNLTDGEEFEEIEEESTEAKDVVGCDINAKDPCNGLCKDNEECVYEDVGAVPETVYNCFCESTTTTATIFDTDRGYDLYEKGVCYDGNYDVDNMPAGWFNLKYWNTTDKCIFSNMILEYYLEDGVCKDKYIDCSQFGKSFRCLDGACVSDVTSYILSDSDGGGDYYEQGTCFNGDYYTDYCENDLIYAANDDYVYEYVLDGGECVLTYHSCKNEGKVCLGGKCVDPNDDCEAYCESLSRQSYTSGLCITPDERFYNSTLVCQENLATYHSGSAGTCDADQVCCCK